MNNLDKMSIDELERLLSDATDPTSASTAEAVLQSKCIKFLSSEIAASKEALSANVLNLNGTIGLTNRNIRELRDSIKDSTDKVIDSNKKLALSQNVYSTLMGFLTLSLVFVGVFQGIMMAKQLSIMKKQTEIMKMQACDTVSQK